MKSTILEGNLNKKTHFLREISKSMYIKKVAKNIFFATSLAASLGYSCYKLLNNVAKVRSIYQKTAPRDGAVEWRGEV